MATPFNSESLNLFHVCTFIVELREKAIAINAKSWFCGNCTKNQLFERKSISSNSNLTFVWFRGYFVFGRYNGGFEVKKNRMLMVSPFKIGAALCALHSYSTHAPFSQNFTNTLIKLMSKLAQSLGNRDCAGS